MSFWATVGVKIEDLGCFRAACERNQIEFNDNPRIRDFRGEEVVAEVRDLKGTGMGYIVRSKGALRLALDTDAHYSSLTKRLGANGGKLGQDYSREVIRKESMNAGGVILNETVDTQGWLTVRVGR
jgi:hypothetical protein